MPSDLLFVNSLGGGANETARNQEEEEEETCNAKSLILNVPFRDRRKKLICGMLDVRWTASVEIRK